MTEKTERAKAPAKDLPTLLAEIDAIPGLTPLDVALRKFILSEAFHLNETEDPCMVCGTHPMARLTLLSAAMASAIDRLRKSAGIGLIITPPAELSAQVINDLVGSLAQAGFRIVYDPIPEIDALVRAGAADDLEQHIARHGGRN